MYPETGTRWRPFQSVVGNFSQAWTASVYPKNSSKPWSIG